MFRVVLPALLIVYVPAMVGLMQVARHFVRLPSSFGFWMVMSWLGLGMYTVLSQKSSMRRAFRRASARGDVKNMRRALGYLATMVEPWQRSLLEATVLMKERRFREAREMMLTVDRTQLEPAYRAVVDNNIAWCLVEEGGGAAALPLARSAVKDAKDEAVAAAYGTLGAALHQSGDSAQGLDALDRSIAMGGRGQMLAIRHYYRGECLRALGRTDDAAGAFSAAIAAAPKSEYGRRAQTQLQTLSPQPYR